MNTSDFLNCEALCKSYDGPEGRISILDRIDLSLEAGGSLAITGPSGSGKSTLLHLLAGLESPTSGYIFFKGQSLFGIGEAERTRLRAHAIGMIFQDHHLLPHLTLSENIQLPSLILRDPSLIKNARELLVELGLEHRAQHFPSQCSGGERQRAAVARALVHRPAMVLADEPTGALDATRAASLMDLILRLHGQFQFALILVTHAEPLAKKLQRHLQLSEGGLKQL